MGSLKAVSWGVLLAGCWALKLVGCWVFQLVDRTVAVGDVQSVGMLDDMSAVLMVGCLEVKMVVMKAHSTVVRKVWCFLRSNKS
jgi:hypothetical protein